MIEIGTYFAAFLLSYFCVELLRRWVSKKQIFDIPNERSSHSIPTPRGGGLAIVGVSLCFYGLGSFILPITFHWSFFAGGLFIALISWLDDMYSISFSWRILVHSISAILVIYQLGFWRVVTIPFYGEIDFGGFGAVITFLWIVWLTNAFNFMDGIDGIAGLQAVTAGIGWLVAGIILGVDSISILGGLLAFSSLGFLIHNWAPATIFMGDVGSAFLGFSFAVIPLTYPTSAKSSLWAIATAFVFFILLDTVFTFFRRLIKREQVWNPHREHLYQKLVIKGYSHQTISILYGALSAALITLALIWANYLY